jgi:7,8-dihydropterin-6-yl-methyl-4-(beta-D-ribofuranosyl)aminobenzene 5'-phosphate synthase
MDIKITTLSENTAGLPGYLAEWGLSMLIEADNTKILFDTGAGASTVHNAELMDIEFKDIDRIVISHGHYDHTGGLREVLQKIGRPVEIIAHPDIWSSKYGRIRKGPEHFAGLPFRRELLENLGARFNLTEKPVRLADHFLTTGEIPMVTDYEEIDSGLFDKETGEMIPDKLADDMGLVIDADYGLVVILGCAHRGIVNTLKQAQKITGKELIYAAIGGTHLLNASQERWEKTAADLMEMGVQYLGVSHCTGFAASAYLATMFGDKFFLNNAGSRWTLPFKEAPGAE